METRILVFADQSAAAAAVYRIGANMGLKGTTFLYAIPRALADGRWHVPYPGDAAWLAGVEGFTVAQGLGLVAVGEAAPDRPFVPPTITNYQCRAALMRLPSPTGIAGRSLFEDVDAAMKAAGGEDLQAWEYNNTVARDSALVTALAARLGQSESQMDQLFITADGISA